MCLSFFVFEDHLEICNLTDHRTTDRFTSAGNPVLFVLFVSLCSFVLEEQLKIRSLTDHRTTDRFTSAASLFYLSLPVLLWC